MQILKNDGAVLPIVELKAFSKMALVFSLTQIIILDSSAFKLINTSPKTNNAGVMMSELW